MRLRQQARQWESTTGKARLFLVTSGRSDQNLGIWRQPRPKALLIEKARPNEAAGGSRDSAVNSLSRNDHRYAGQEGAIRLSRG